MLYVNLPPSWAYSSLLEIQLKHVYDLKVVAGFNLRSTHIPAEFPTKVNPIWVSHHGRVLIG
jgi:hypothetical protein